MLFAEARRKSEKPSLSSKCLGASVAGIDQWTRPVLGKYRSEKGKGSEGVLRGQTMNNDVVAKSDTEPQTAGIDPRGLMSTPTKGATTRRPDQEPGVLQVLRRFCFSRGLGWTLFQTSQNHRPIIADHARRNPTAMSISHDTKLARARRAGIFGKHR